MSAATARRGTRSAAARAAPAMLAGALLAAACATAPVPAPAPGARPGPGAPATARAADAVDLARSLLGAPYRYGGGDPRGFDCSGFTSYVLSAVGVALPRRAEEQADSGDWVALDELAPGDLVFFSRGRAKPHHVGLVVSRPGARLTMIHASSSRGVVQTVVPRSAYWLQRLRFGRRVLGGG